MGRRATWARRSDHCLDAINSTPGAVVTCLAGVSCLHRLRLFDLPQRTFRRAAIIDGPNVGNFTQWPQTVQGTVKYGPRCPNTQRRLREHKKSQYQE